MKENILGFEISMNDIVVVHKLKGVTDLSNNGLDLSFREYLLPSQMSVKISWKA